MAFRDIDQLARDYGVQDFSERIIKTVQPPLGYASDADFYQTVDGPDGPRICVNVVFLRMHFYREGRLTEDQVLFILREAAAKFREEPNVLRVPSPVTSEYRRRRGLIDGEPDHFAVVGDIHGQFVRRAEDCVLPSLWQELIIEY